MSKLKTIKENPFQDEFLGADLIEWFTAHRMTILYGVIALFAGILLTYRFISSQTENSEKEFLNAKNLFEKFEQQSLNIQISEAEQSFKELESLLATIPNLHAKYDGQIAQLQMLNGEEEKANQIAKSLFARTYDKNLETYQDYAKASLMVTAGNYSGALQNAEELKAKLQNGENEILTAFNLVRIAMLHQKLDHLQEEKAAWTELKQRFQPGTRGFAALQALLQKGNESFESYLQHRATGF